MTGDLAARRRASRYGGLAGSAMLALAAYLGGALTLWRSHGSPVDVWQGPYGPLILILWLAGTAALVTAWWAVRDAVPSIRWAYVTAGLWLIPVLVAPPLGSRDVYAYACQGAVYAAGHNPYHQGVAALPCPWLDSVSPIWRDTPAPYGPLFVVLAGAVVGLTGSLVASIVALRVVAVVGVAATAVCLPVLARRYGVPPGRAVWLALACPLIAIHLASGGHNDALMIGLLVAGLAVAVARPDRAGALLSGGVLLGLAGAVKATALVLVPFAALVPVAALMAARGPLATGARPAVPVWPTGRRVAGGGAVSTRGLPRWPPGLRAAGGGAVWTFGAFRPYAAGLWVVGGAVASMLAATWLSGLGMGWVGGLSHSGDSVQWTSPPTAVGMTIDYLGRVSGAPLHAVPGTRAVAIVLLAVGLLGLFVRAVRRGDPLYHGALAMVAITLLGPVFHPWYAIAPLTLLAATARRPWWFVVACAILSFIVLPNGANLAVYTKLPGALSMTAAVLLGAAWALHRVVRAARRAARSGEPPRGTTHAIPGGPGVRGAR